MLYTEHQLQAACYQSLSHLFSLVVGLPHFDVCNQVPPCAGIQHVRHRDHQVIERSPLGLFSCTQLIPEELKVTFIVQFSRKIHQVDHFPAHLLSFGPAADFQPLTLADGHLERDGDPHVSKILCPRIEGEALHAADLLPAAKTRTGKRCDKTAFDTPPSPRLRL